MGDLPTNPILSTSLAAVHTQSAPVANMIPLSNTPHRSPPGLANGRPRIARPAPTSKERSISLAEEIESSRKKVPTADVTRKRTASPTPATSTPPAKRVTASSSPLVPYPDSPEVIRDDEPLRDADTMVGGNLFMSDASSPIPAPAAAARNLWRAKVDAALKGCPPRELIVHASDFVIVKTTVIEKLSLKQGSKGYDAAIHIIEQQLLFWAENFGIKGITRLTEFAQSLHDKENDIATSRVPDAPNMGEETIKDLIELRDFITKSAERYGEMNFGWCKATAQFFKIFERFKAAESKKPFPAETCEIIRTIILGVDPGLAADPQKLMAARKEFSLEIHFGLTLAHIQQCFSYGAFVLLPQSLQEDTLSRSGAEQRIARNVTSVLAEQQPVLAKVCITIAQNLIIPVTNGLKPKKICALLPKHDMADASLEYLAQEQDDAADEPDERDASIDIEDLDDAESPKQTSLQTKSRDPRHVAESPTPTKENEAPQDCQSNPQRSLIAASSKRSSREADTEREDDVVQPPAQLPSGKILPSNSRSGLGLQRKTFAPLPDNLPDELRGIQCLLASVKDDSPSPRVSPHATNPTKTTFTAAADKGAEFEPPGKSTFTAAQEDDDDEACQIRPHEDPEDDETFVPERKRHQHARKDSLTTPQTSNIKVHKRFNRTDSSGKKSKNATQLRARKGLDVLNNISVSDPTTKQSTPRQYDIWKNIDITRTTVQCTSPILTTTKQPSKKSIKSEPSTPSRRRRLIEEDSDDGFIVHDEDEEKLIETYEEEKHEPEASTPSRSEAVELSSDDDVEITGSSTRTLITRSATRNLKTYGGVIVDTTPTRGVSKKTANDISSADESASSGDTSDEEGMYDNKKAGRTVAFGGRFV